MTQSFAKQNKHCFLSTFKIEKEKLKWLKFDFSELYFDVWHLMEQRNCFSSK